VLVQRPVPEPLEAIGVFVPLEAVGVSVPLDAGGVSAPLEIDGVATAWEADGVSAPLEVDGVAATGVSTALEGWGSICMVVMVADWITEGVPQLEVTSPVWVIVT